MAAGSLARALRWLSGSLKGQAGRLAGPASPAHSSFAVAGT